MTATTANPSLRDQVDLTARMTAVKAAEAAAHQNLVSRYTRNVQKPTKEQQDAIDGLAATLKTPDAMAMLVGDAGTGKTWTLTRAAERSRLRMIDKNELRSNQGKQQPMTASYAEAFAKAYPGEPCGDTVFVSKESGLVVATPTHKAAAVLKRKSARQLLPVTLASLTRVGQNVTPLGKSIWKWLAAGMPGEPPCLIPGSVWRNPGEGRPVIATLLKGMGPLEVAEHLLCIPHDRLYAYTGRLYLPDAALIVDEGSMVQGTMLPLLFAMFGRGVVIAGDTKQLPPVITKDSPDGWWYTSILDRAEACDVPTFRLTQIMRQSDKAATILFENARALYDENVLSLPEAPPAIVHAKGLTPQELHEGLAPEAGADARVFTPIICAQRKTVVKTNRHLMAALGFTGLAPGLPVIAESSGGKMSDRMLVDIARLLDDPESGFAGAAVAQYSTVHTNTLWRVMAVAKIGRDTVARLRSLDESDGSDVIQFVRLKGASAGLGREITVGFASTAHAMQGDEAPIALLNSESFCGARLLDASAQRSWVYVALTRGRYAAASVSELHHDGKAHHLGCMHGELAHLPDEALGHRPKY